MLCKPVINFEWDKGREKISMAGIVHIYCFWLCYDALVFRSVFILSLRNALCQRSHYSWKQVFWKQKKKWINAYLYLPQARRLKAIAEDPAIAAEAAKQPPEEDDEKDEIDDEIIITHL